MSLFFRQSGRARRVDPEKVRTPLPPGPGRHERARVAQPLIIGAIFAALLVAAVTWGRPPIRYSPGEVATTDVTARVAFDFVDDEATRETRRMAKLGAPSVYNADNAPLDACRADVFQSLDKLAAAPDAAARTAAAAELGAVPETEVPLLAADARRADGGAVRATVLQALRQLSTAGIMSDARDAEERRAFSREALVVRRPDMPPERAELRHVLSMTETAGQVGTILSDKLGPLGLKETARVVAGAMAARLRPTLVFDAAASKRVRDEASERVPPQRVEKKPGEILVARGEVVWRRQYDMLLAEQEAYRAGRDPFEQIKEIAGVAVVVIVAFVIAGLYLRLYRPQALQSAMRLSLLGALAVGIVLATRALFHTPWISQPLHLVPVAFASMLLALAYDRRFACGATVFLVVMAGLATEAEAPLRPVLALLAGGLVAAALTHNIRKRTSLITIGFLAGLAHAATIVGVGLGQFQGTAGATLWEAVREQARVLGLPALIGLGNGLAVGIVLTGLLPLLERAFRITTGISLLELGDLNQPALKSYALRAPGSYNHSLSVAALAEAAARAVGADDLLARVGSYFHDIGKLNKPNYFVENQTDVNPHDRLSPHMSALIIIAHVKDGLELARELRLPRRIQDVIAEHHGTTTVEYFYRRAKEEAGQDRPPDDYVFRYPGPRPRSKETAIVMLADSVESASRTLDDPTPAGIENLVRRIVQAKLADGQFDACTLTLAELHAVERSLTRGLISIFHGRIRY